MTEDDNEGRGGDAGTAIAASTLIGAVVWIGMTYLFGWRIVVGGACIATISILVLWMRT